MVEVLRIGEHFTRVIECVDVDLAHVLQSLSNVLVARLQMHINELESTIIEVEANSNRALIARHAIKARLHHQFADLAEPAQVLLLRNHQDVLANHDFLRH